MRRNGNSVVAPTITSFSPDTNIVGDGITDSSILTLDGTAAANSTVKVYDGTVLIGTTIANAKGLWTFATGTLVDGVHHFTATDTASGTTSASSAVETITVDTAAPEAPLIVSENATGLFQVALNGTAEAGSKVTVYDGSVAVGSATASSVGAWSITSSTLPTGTQTFTATATDAAGNVSGPSQSVTQTVAASPANGTAAPAEAALQNYSHLAFDDEFNSLGTIDMSNSHTGGYNWYVQDWFSSASTNPNNVTISNGVLELGGGTGGYASLVSAFANSNGGYTGTVFGDGAYMEASIKFNPGGGSGAMYWPAFWGLSIQHIIDPGADGVSQWVGQGAGYTHYAEADIMEYMTGIGSNTYLGTIHDWSGTYTSNGWQFNIANSGNSFINIGAVDWNAFHTYGLLWVPQSGNTPGHVTWYFDGHPETTIYWLGPATSTSLPGISTGGSFTPSTSTEAASTYSILDSQQLALSLDTDSSWPMYVDWVKVWQSGSTTQTTVAAPVITSFSPDSGVVGDGVTNSKTVVLTGTAEANSVELVYDGTTWLGSATANANGAWTFTTSTLADGTHNFTAVSNDIAGDTSAASAALTVTVNTVAPTVAENLVHDTGSSTTDLITSNAALGGTSDPNAVIHFTVDGKAITSTVTADATGTWSFSPTGLADGTHTIVASETNAAGNTGSASLTFTLDTTAPTLAIGNETLSGGNATLTGTAGETGDTISVYDGATLLGTTTSGNGGAWTYSIGAVSNAIHNFTATATDAAGNIGNGSNAAMLGTTNADTLVASGHDIVLGNGGNDVFVGAGGGNTLIAGSGNDSFVFKSVTDSMPTNFDTIVGFDHVHDSIQFSGISGINAITFQGQLASSGNISLNAHSIAFIETGGNTEVLINTTNSHVTVSAQNTQAASMEIILTGTHLGLTSSDFHIA